MTPTTSRFCPEWSAHHLRRPPAYLVWQQFHRAHRGNLRLFNKVRTRLQLNVPNVLKDGRLQPIAYNPDGQAWNCRIIDPRQFILFPAFPLL